MEMLEKIRKSLILADTFIEDSIVHLRCLENAKNKNLKISD